jgi:hypothetical protein
LNRSVIYIPIIHTSLDMGSLAESVRSEYVKRHGEEAWRRHVEIVEQMWTEIERNLDAMALDWGKCRIFQDSLPVCGHESEIVADLAQRGSRNHRLILKLMARGAVLMGTESPTLLLEEYREAIRFQAAPKEPAAPRSGIRKDPVPHPSRTPAEPPRASDLLRRRDQFVAMRIDETLAPGETGVVLMGLLHGLDRYLPRDIAVRPLVARLCFEEARRC